MSAAFSIKNGSELEDRDDERVPILIWKCLAGKPNSSREFIRSEVSFFNPGGWIYEMKVFVFQLHEIPSAMPMPAAFGTRFEFDQLAMAEQIQIF
jgi:hypothetical protein